MVKRYPLEVVIMVQTHHPEQTKIFYGIISNLINYHLHMSYKYPASVLCDFYKIAHREQYTPNTQLVYSTWTPRMSRLEGVNEVVAFGFQAFIKQYLINYFNDNFFNRPLKEIVFEYKRVIKNTLGSEPDTSHIIALHNLGYLPLRIQAVPEGLLVPVRVPMLTIENTHADFFWLTNYIETLMSCSLWQMSTSATIAHEYKKLLLNYAKKTGGDINFVPFQGHDFSMRGMSSLETVKYSAAGHLLSFTGTDSIPGILFLEEFYNANIEKELVGTSIPATEHSVMCSYGQVNEFEAYKRLITEVYPKGFVSIVSDTWDLWKTLREIITLLKTDILLRDGKVVIRPDSGNPVDIICGDPTSDNVDVQKGVIEILWDIFGGTVNSKGYKELNSHIGCIYGDAITLTRCREICEKLEKKGFASTNMVYGIGSYTYQYNTRDTFGFALKSTYSVINGQEVFLFKNPVTDRGFKKSQTGKVAVLSKKTGYRLMEGLKQSDKDAYFGRDLLEDVFVDGKLVRDDSLSDIRKRIYDSI